MYNNIKKMHVRYKKDSIALLTLISEELEKHNQENPAWSDLGEIEKLRRGLKQVLLDIRFKINSDMHAVSTEIEKEIENLKDRE